MAFFLLHDALCFRHILDQPGIMSACNIFTGFQQIDDEGQTENPAQYAVPPDLEACGHGMFARIFAPDCAVPGFVFRHLLQDRLVRAFGAFGEFPVYQTIRGFINLHVGQQA